MLERMKGTNSEKTIAKKSKKGVQLVSLRAPNSGIQEKTTFVNVERLEHIVPIGSTITINLT